MSAGSSANASISTLARESTGRAINPWIVAVCVVVPTFMEVLDTTVANVALRYIAGGLSAASSDAEWIITSYLAANAIVLPISGWIAARVGRRNYFLVSIAVFTIASVLCGIATSLEQLIAFRILQGLAGGGLQPSSQAIILDTFPSEKQGGAMAAFGIAALIAPIVGPTLGGYLTDNYDWRWIFYINIPVGAVAFAASYFIVRDPPYLRQQQATLRGLPLRFDIVGLSLLTLAIACWEVLLSKGQEWDWFGDPFWRIQTLAFLFVVGLGWLIFHELRTSHPLVNLRPFADRNFAVACLIIFFAYAVLYASSTSLPALLQSLLGYDAYRSGLVLSPAGISSVFMMAIVGLLLNRQVDSRWLIAIGLLVIGASNWWMAHLNLDVSPIHVIVPRMVLTAGLGMVFAPLSVAAYRYIPLHLRGAAVGLFSLLRNEGGSVGTSVATSIQQRREQVHLNRLGEFIDPLNPNVQELTEPVEQVFFQDVGDPVLAQQLALQTLSDVRQQQAAALAYFDIFWIAAVLAFVLATATLVMRRSVAEKGSHVAAE